MHKKRQRPNPRTPNIPLSIHDKKGIYYGMYIKYVFFSFCKKSYFESYIFLRYWPPTSYNAFVIWPRLATLTVSINSSKMLPPDKCHFLEPFERLLRICLYGVPGMLASCGFAVLFLPSLRGPLPFCRFLRWKRFGLRYVLTPMIGSSPECFNCS